MLRMMGIGIKVPKGGYKSTILRPEGVSDRQWRGLIGNSVPVSMMQRVLAPLMTYGGLKSRPVADIWASNV
jgi:hypothetical protein